MDYQVQAIFEDGVLKPLEPLKLSEHQKVDLIIRVPTSVNAASELDEWHQVFAGLSEQVIAEIVTIANDRNRSAQTTNS